MAEFIHYMYKICKLIDEKLLKKKTLLFLQKSVTGIQPSFPFMIKIFCWKKEQTQGRLLSKQLARNFRLNYAMT